MINLILISLLCGKVGFEGNVFSQSVFSVGSQRLVQPDAYKPPNTFVYIAEGIGATAGGVSGAFCGGFLMWLLTVDRGRGATSSSTCAMDPSKWAFIEEKLLSIYRGMLGGYILGSACGTTITGKILNQRGSFWKSVIGSTIGTIGGLIVLRKIREPHPIIMIGATFLPITGAVIGYNWGR
jgi:hypothetical protein